MFGRLIWLIIFVIVISLALMFDWFGARDMLQQVLGFTESTADALSETGDRLQGLYETKK